MRKWTFLAAAIVSELTATLCLRGAVDHPALFVVVVVGYTLSLVWLAKVLQLGVPVGVAYGIWGATGVAATAIAATILFGDPFTAVMGVGVVLIGAGVLLIELGQQRAHAQAGGGRRAGR